MCPCDAHIPTNFHTVRRGWSSRGRADAATGVHTLFWDAAQIAMAHCAVHAHNNRRCHAHRAISMRIAETTKSFVFPHSSGSVAENRLCRKARTLRSKYRWAGQPFRSPPELARYWLARQVNVIAAQREDLLPMPLRERRRRPHMVDRSFTSGARIRFGRSSSASLSGTGGNIH